MRGASRNSSLRRCAAARCTAASSPHRQPPSSIANTCAVRGAPSNASFFVVEPESRALAGVVNINDIVRHAEQSGRLGYYAFTPWAGTGLMCAGLRLVIGVAFRELGLHRLEANIQRNNARSIALVEGLGFQPRRHRARLS